MPLANDLAERRREALGLCSLRPWDYGVDPLGAAVFVYAYVAEIRLVGAFESFAHNGREWAPGSWSGRAGITQTARQLDAFGVAEQPGGGWPACTGAVRLGLFVGGCTLGRKHGDPGSSQRAFKRQSIFLAPALVCAGRPRLKYRNRTLT